MSSYLTDSLWCGAEGVVAVLVVVGNCLSIVLFLKNHRLRRMRTSSLLINLAAADLIVGAVTLPMYIALTWPGRNFALHRNFEFYLAFLSVDILSGFGSVFGLTIIALERMYSVFFPHRHRRTSRKFYFILIAVIWMLAALQMLLRILFGYKVVSFEGFFYFMIICLTICLVIICSSYIGVWFRVHFRDPKQANRRTQSDQRHETKLAVTLAIITVLFILTWVPFHILNMVMFFCVSCRRTLPLESVYFFKLLHYSNSLINPVVYSSRFPEFRRTIQNICCCNGSVARVSPSRVITVPPTVVECSRREITMISI